jgi:hypothetical protein
VIVCGSKFRTIPYKAHVSVAHSVRQHRKEINAEESVQGPSDRCIPREQISSLEIYKPVVRTAGRPVFQKTLNKSKKYTGSELTTKEIYLPK